MDSSGSDSSTSRPALRPSTRNDVEVLYRLFLGRSPESEAVVTGKLAFTLDALLEQVIRSDEFRGSLADWLLDGDLAEPSPTILNSFRQWALSLYDSGAAPAEVTAAPSRGHLLWALLREEELIKILGAAGRGSVDQARVRQLSELLRTRPRRIDASFERVDEERLRGWAVDVIDPTARLTLEIWVDGAICATCCTGGFRREIQDHYGAGTMAGFELLWTPPLRSGGKPLAVELREPGRPQPLARTMLVLDREPHIQALEAVRDELSTVRESLDRLESVVRSLGGLFGFSIRRYQDYCRAYRVRTPAQAVRARAVVESRVDWPRVRVLVSGPTEACAATRQSLLRQSYPANLVEVITTPTLSQATLASLSVEEGFVLLLEAGETLEDDALLGFAQCAISSGAEMVFADDDVYEDLEGRGILYSAPRLKPAFDLDLLLQRNDLGSVFVRSRALMQTVHSWPASVASRDSLSLHIAVAGGGKVSHLPGVLVHRKHDALGSQSFNIPELEVVLSTCAPGITVTEASDVLTSHRINALRVAWPLPPDLTAAVIIPTRDRPDLLGACLRGIERTELPPGLKIKIVIVNNSGDLSLLKGLSSQFHHTLDLLILTFDEEFNWGRLNNFAVRNVCADVYIFLNDDTSVIDPGWAQELCRQAWRPDVGAVGGRLIYEDGTLQHAGIVMGGSPAVCHEAVGEPGESRGHMDRHVLVHRTSAVTGACLATSAAAFQRLGGFEEKLLKIDSSDVDYCLRSEKAGLSVLYTPYCTLYHFESKSRGFNSSDPARAERGEREFNALRLRWRDRILADPWYNPHFDRFSGPFERLGQPPEVLSLN